MNDPQTKLLQQALADIQSGDADQRDAALRRLRDEPHAMLDNETIATVLIPLLKAPDPMVRRLTAEVLGRSGNPGAVEPLLDVQFDEDVAVRVAVVDALGMLEARAAVSGLLESVYDESVYVRFAAAKALGQIGDPRAVVDLIWMLDNDDAPIAMIAAQSLHKIGTPEALAAIQHLKLSDEDDAAYDFTVPPDQDFTLPHIPLPPIGDRNTAAPAEEFAESMRGIPRDMIDDLLEQRNKEKEKEEDEAAPAKPMRSAETTRAEPPPAMPAPSSSLPTPPSPIAAPKPDAPSSADQSDVQFSAYYPREAVPDVWYPLRAYVFRQRAADAVSADASRELGGLLSAFREVVRTALGSVATGALVTATPELAGFQFNPPSAQIGFYEDWHRFDFKLRPTASAADQASNGHITFTIEGVIVADMPLSIYVGSNVSSNAEPIASIQRPAYRAIFCSYSHKDTQIVERVERAYKALGLDYLRDVVTLKSGQDWNAELLDMIDRADIFQLFWSETAAASKYVRQEWEHALSLSREQGFIRPVYWSQPMPSVPPELSAIHFAYEPTLDDHEDRR